MDQKWFASFLEKIAAGSILVALYNGKYYGIAVAVYCLIVIKILLKGGPR